MVRSGTWPACRGDWALGVLEIASLPVAGSRASHAQPDPNWVAPAAATSKHAAKATWRQRLMCGLPACYYDPVDSLLLDVHDDNADSAAAMGRCDNILFQPTVCTDIDGNSLFNNGDDDDDSSRSSSEL